MSVVNTQGNTLRTQAHYYPQLNQNLFFHFIRLCKLVLYPQTVLYPPSLILNLVVLTSLFKVKLACKPN